MKPVHNLAISCTRLQNAVLAKHVSRLLKIKVSCVSLLRPGEKNNNLSKNILQLFCRKMNQSSDDGVKINK